MYRFYFEDTLEYVEWYDHPDRKLGPYRSAIEALEDLWNLGICEPADVCYILMTEDQVKLLRKSIGGSNG